jgi:biotin synthase
MTHSTIQSARADLLENGRPAGAELLAELAALPAEHVPDLLTLADAVRTHYCGNAIAVEVLYNAKRGGCSEDCNFCSQSARYATDVEPEKLSSVEDFVEAARAAHLRSRVIEAAKQIKAELPLTVAVSLGILTDAHIQRLAQAGVDKVNHNLETSRRYFPQVCTTHTYDERWETCQRVKRANLELCCGGIIGMGEEVADRLDFLAALQALQPHEVPINFLNPRPGTPFGNRALLDPVEALRFVAMARLALPTALVRFAGGRELTLKALQDVGMRSGASGIVLGDYLTTKGRSDADDFLMLERLGFEVLA